MITMCLVLCGSKDVTVGIGFDLYCSGFHTAECICTCCDAKWYDDTIDINTIKDVTHE